MRLWRGILAGALALSLAVPVCAAPVEDAVVQQRQEDLNILYDTLKRGHPDLFANTPEEEFLARKGEIEKSLATASDQIFALDLQSLAAMVGDSHTTMALGGLAQTMRYYPMALTWRDGAWYLTTAPAEGKALLGRQVTAVNGRTMEQVVEAFGAVLSADNQVKLRRQYRQTCNVADFYEYLGLAEKGEPLALALAGGESLELAPVAVEELGRMDLAQLGASLPQPATAGQDQNYLAFPLNDSAYYIQYNNCMEDPDLPMEDFAGQVRAELEAGDYHRVLLDFRNNGGGSDGVIWPLLEALRQEMDRGTEVVGLIGEATFSSAIINAVELQEMGAALVGDLTSGSVDHFGSVGSFRLPNSGLQVGCSRKYIDLGTLLDADAGRGVEPLEPDVLVPQTMEDTLEGRDTAVDWLLAHPQRLERKEYPDAPLTRGRFAALLWQAAGRPDAQDVEIADALGIEWYLPALCWAVESGVSAGTGEGGFQAARPITRQEAAVMAVKAAQLSGRSGQGEFTEPADEDQIAPWALEGVRQALSLGLMELQGGAFRPLDPMTRSEGEKLASLLTQK